MSGRAELSFISLVGVHGVLDAVAGLLMLWSALRITTDWGWHTIRKRWAFFRRVVYFLMAFALFGLGIGHLDGRYANTIQETLFQILLVMGIMVFPLLRAFGLISQDALLIDKTRSGHDAKSNDPL
jgi:hypothetical protein